MKISLTSIFVDDPVKAHTFYTETLGFRSKEFSAASQLAIIVSDEDPDGTALLLEPRGDSFGLEYQTKVYESGLPTIVFSVNDLKSTVNRLRSLGVVFRDDLAKPAWGLENMFEDTCGNLIMLQEESNG